MTTLCQQVFKGGKIILISEFGCSISDLKRLSSLRGDALQRFTSFCLDSWFLILDSLFRVP